jgi:hypothetical protein
MSCRKGKKGEDEDSESEDSIFLDLLPVAHRLEASKQRSIFKMMGAEGEVKRQHEETVRQFRDTAKQISRTAIKQRERRRQKSFMRKVMANIDKALENVDTQALRTDAIKKIERLIADAIKHGKEKDLTERSRVEWFRVVGYLFQVLRNIMHEYDTGQIQEELRKLKEVVYNELRKKSGAAGARQT